MFRDVPGFIDGPLISHSSKMSMNECQYILVTSCKTGNNASLLCFTDRVKASIMHLHASLILV